MSDFHRDHRGPQADAHLAHDQLAYSSGYVLRVSYGYEYFRYVSTAEATYVSQPVSRSVQAYATIESPGNPALVRNEPTPVHAVHAPFIYVPQRLPEPQYVPYVPPAPANSAFMPPWQAVPVRHDPPRTTGISGIPPGPYYAPQRAPGSHLQPIDWAVLRNWRPSPPLAARPPPDPHHHERCEFGTPQAGQRGTGYSSWTEEVTEEATRTHTKHERPPAPAPDEPEVSQHAEERRTRVQRWARDVSATAAPVPDVSQVGILQELGGDEEVRRWDAVWGEGWTAGYDTP